MHDPVFDINANGNAGYLTVFLVCRKTNKLEAQLMLTNLRDAFRGQSRSTNMEPFWVRSTYRYSM